MVKIFSNLNALLFLKSMDFGKKWLSWRKLRPNLMLTIFFTNRWIKAYKKSFKLGKNEITLPYIIITMTIGKSFVDSKLLSAIINVEQVMRVSTFQKFFFQKFFINYPQALNSTEVVIRTEKRYDSCKKLCQWSREESFYLDCSITFNYDGKYKHELQIAEKLLLSQERILNLETFSSLFGDDRFADFTFIVQGREFKVHKCLLAGVSSVFELMFTCGLDETKTNKVKIDCKPVIFMTFLEFIYKNTLRFKEIPTPHYFDLYQLAHYYNIAPLMKICLAVIMMIKVDSSNVLHLYEFAGAYNIKELTDKTWTFIKM